MHFNARVASQKMILELIGPTTTSVCSTDFVLKLENNKTMFFSKQTIFLTRHVLEREEDGLVSWREYMERVRHMPEK